MDLVIFTEEILDGISHFLFSENLNIKILTKDQVEMYSFETFQFHLVYFAEVFIDYNKSIQRSIRCFPKKKLKNSKIFPNRYLKRGITCSAKKYVITIDRKNILWGKTII